MVFSWIEYLCVYARGWMMGKLHDRNTTKVFAFFFLLALSATLPVPLSLSLSRTLSSWFVWCCSNPISILHHTCTWISKQFSVKMNVWEPGCGAAEASTVNVPCFSAFDLFFFFSSLSLYLARYKLLSISYTCACCALEWIDFSAPFRTSFFFRRDHITTRILEQFFLFFKKKKKRCEKIFTSNQSTLLCRCTMLKRLNIHIFMYNFTCRNTSIYPTCHHFVSGSSTFFVDFMLLEYCREFATCDHFWFS